MTGWPSLGDMRLGGSPRPFVVEYRGNRRVVAGVDERTQLITAFVCERQDGPLRAWRVVLSTPDAQHAADWLAGASLPLTPALPA